MVRRKRIVAVVTAVGLLVTTAGVLGAETRVGTEVESFATAVWTGSELGLAGLSRGTVDFRSSGNRNVQSRLQLRLTLLDDATDAPSPAFLEVPRASIRFRFPVNDSYTLRVTAGRDRLSWGLGSLFNAADLLFGADGRTAADLTRSGDVRDETAWLLAFYFPLGELGYLETTALPPLPDIAGGDALGENDSESPGEATSQAPPVASVGETRAGLRVHSAAGPVSVEPSYLYDGAAGIHRIGFALQGALGALGADVYTAAALHLPDGGLENNQKLYDYSVVSAGALWIARVGYDQSISFRGETLIHPGAQNALLLYPEIVWSAGPTVQLIGRAVYSPTDTPSEITTGVSWNVFQGFYALLFAGVYGWDQPGSMWTSAGFRYLF